MIRKLLGLALLVWTMNYMLNNCVCSLKKDLTSS